jgi:V8-like Glu-specific endopeptidase
MGLEACVFQVRNSQGEFAGTGFAISPDLVVTCAHVVNFCKAKIGELLSLFFYPERIELKAEVLSDGWNEEKNVAFLRLHSSLPPGAMHMGERLGSFGSETEINRNLLAFGYATTRSGDMGLFARGLIVGQVYNNHGNLELQLKLQGIAPGMSGTPIMDEESGLIVGMLQRAQLRDETGRFCDLAYALPIEILGELSPDKLTIEDVTRKVSIEACIFQVRDSHGIVRGTGFAISPDLVVTCAHVVNDCKAKIGELLSLFFYPEGIELKAELLSDGWSLEEDVAFLRLNSPLPRGANHMGKRLGSFGSETEIKRHFRAFGYPNIKSDVRGFFAQGLIKGQIRSDKGALRLQLESQDITYGMSGAPIMDEESGFIVGMVQKTQIPDATGKFRDMAYALPLEVLCKLSPYMLIINDIFE